MWDWNFLKDEIYFIDSCYRMLSYESADLPQSAHWWRELVHPENLSGTLRDFGNHSKNKTDYYEILLSGKSFTPNKIKG
jgi:hypothetical protein